MNINIRIKGNKKTKTAGILHIEVNMLHSYFSEIKQKHNLPDTFDFDKAFMEIMEEILRKITEQCEDKISNLSIDFKCCSPLLHMPLKDDVGSIIFRIADVKECERIKKG